jgi:protein-disulfide isomerase
MRRELTFASGLLLAGVGLFGCQQQNDEVNKKLDAINKKLDDLATKVGQVQQRPQMPQPPPGPDPNAIYAVAIDGSAVSGPKNAKVTIVEAFEFA